MQAALEGQRQLYAALRARSGLLLSQCLDRQEATLEELRGLAGSRQAFVKEIADTLGAAPSMIRIGWLAARAPAETSRQLIQKRDCLCRLLDEVQRLQETNLVLLRHGLEFFNNVFASFSGVAAPTSAYGPTGKPTPTPAVPLFHARG